jgi:hypothetical protein
MNSYAQTIKKRLFCAAPARIRSAKKFTKVTLSSDQRSEIHNSQSAIRNSLPPFVFFRYAYRIPAGAAWDILLITIKRNLI